MGSLAGVLAAKDAMRRYGIPGRIKFFGEPAEKMCGSKPLHAANGYYDDVDAFISFHPSCRLSLCNTVYWDIHCGSSYGRVFTFECTHPETWGEAHGRMLMPLQQVVARAPGALDAVCLMYTTSRYTNTSMLPRSGGWYISEAILVGGQATADHLAPRLGQIYYCWRAPTLEMQDRIAEVLENNAKHVAAITHCEVRGDWVQKNRIGRRTHALARLAYRNMELAGPPQFGEEAQEFGRQILRNLGHTPPERPIMPECSELHDPLEADRALREGSRRGRRISCPTTTWSTRGTRPRCGCSSGGAWSSVRTMRRSTFCPCGCGMRWAANANASIPRFSARRGPSGIRFWT